jgi:hypothetical protein
MSTEGLHALLWCVDLPFEFKLRGEFFLQLLERQFEERKACFRGLVIGVHIPHIAKHE